MKRKLYSRIKKPKGRSDEWLIQIYKGMAQDVWIIGDIVWGNKWPF